jgi:hypothetical protein
MDSTSIFAIYFMTLSQYIDYIVNDEVTSEWWWMHKHKHPCLKWIRTHSLSDQAIKAFASDLATTGIGDSIVKVVSMLTGYTQMEPFPVLLCLLGPSVWSSNCILFIMLSKESCCQYLTNIYAATFFISQALDFQISSVDTNSIAHFVLYSQFCTLC